jgi:crotonobetainyl-CoA:carnitine CoA-transferase CaiB-like acyl-CoA transferase
VRGVSALSGLRIVELAEDVAGEYCGKLLADFGAEVIKIERPGVGSPTRAMAPIVRPEAGVEGSGLFAYLNTNKSSVALDLGAPEDAARLRALIETADAVIDDHDDAWPTGLGPTGLGLAGLGLDEAAREGSHAGVVFCDIRRFGAGAPADWAKARSLNVFHASGWGYHTPSSPDPERPPLKGPGRFLVDYEAGLDAALCVAAALYRRGRDGAGQSIEVSQLEVMVSRTDAVLGRLLAGEEEPGTGRDAYDLNGPADAFACRDGFVYLVVLHRGHWTALRTLMGAPAWMEAFPDDWLEFGVTAERNATFRARFGEWAASGDKEAISDAGQALGLPIAPVNDAADLHRSPQFSFRGFFQPLDHPALGRALYPTTPYKLSATPTRLVRPAPRLGEHTAAVLAGGPRSAPRPLAPPPPRKPTGFPRGGPLEGVRVLEVAKVWAGPHAGKLLAFLGAEVIKVESRSALDEMRGYGGVDVDRAPYFLSLNPEVLSVQVNMKSAQGLGLLRDMAGQSDIVLNNLRPGAMERLGLGYEALREIRSDVIAVSMKMYGNDGPLGQQTGYAPCFAALGGLNYLVGYEGEPPRGVNARYGDSSVGAAAAFAALAALLHRERTGEGQFIDLSAVEMMSSLVGDSLFEYSLTGAAPAAHGDRDPAMAPHGCYPCAEGDWISLAIATDAEWRSLCEALERPALATDARFANPAQRQSNADALDDEVAAATRGQDAADLAERLRASGVPAFKSASSLDIVSDDHLWARGFYRLVSDQANGSRPVLGAPWRFSRTQADIARGAPRLGEHNPYVYGALLGLPPERLAALIGEGVVE